MSLTPNEFALLVAGSAVLAAIFGTGLGLLLAALVRSLRQTPSRLEALRALMRPPK